MLGAVRRFGEDRIILSHIPSSSCFQQSGKQLAHNAYRITDTAGIQDATDAAAGIGMYCNVPDPSSTHDYKGCTISLLVGEAEDGSWRCRYVYIKFSLGDTACLTKYPRGTFATEQEAESAALQKAKTLIDSQNPSPAPLTRVP